MRCLSTVTLAVATGASRICECAPRTDHAVKVLHSGGRRRHRGVRLAKSRVFAPFLIDGLARATGASLETHVVTSHGSFGYFVAYCRIPRLPPNLVFSLRRPRRRVRRRRNPPADRLRIRGRALIRFRNWRCSR